MKIRRLNVNGLNCPFVVCEGCDEVIHVKDNDPRPVVLTRREGFPAFHSWCDPGDTGHQALEKFMSDSAFNSGLGKLTGGTIGEGSDT